MRGFDAFAGAIKSGGKTRRAAKMVILNVEHPDIVDFIDCKALEEKKAWTLIDAGYDGGFNVAGGAYDSVNYQNANHSVRVTDAFMQSVIRDGEWTTRSISGAAVETLRAKEVMRKMADAAWICGDPGIQYDTTVNDWHTCPNTARINASNPCSEYMFLDDSACNLASLNLRKFQFEAGENAGEFNTEAFKKACATTITAMEIIVDNSSYPTQKIARNSWDYRPLGLGFANLGALLMSRGLPYDSQPGRAYAAAITALMCGEAYAQSAKISKDATGPFKGYANNEAPFIRVMKKHRAACDQIDQALVPYDLMQAAKGSWDDAIAVGERYGFRNGQATVLAPTGTIAFLMDCDTTGVEPDIALVKYKRLVGGGLLKTVNHTVPDALAKLGYDAKEIEAIVAYVNARDTIEGAPGLKDEHLAVFDCAFKSQNGERSIHYMGHLRMMSAAQPFLSGAISKTVNLPNDCTVEDIEDAYIEAWKMGLKAIAVYRDGCKRTQPLSTNLKQATSQGRLEAKADVELTDEAVLGRLSREERMLVEALRAKKNRPAGPPIANRYKLPVERHSFTHKFSVGGHEGYITVGMYEDGSPGEIFVRMAKEGSVIAGLMDSFGTAVSLSLQHGVPLQVLIEKFKGTRFEPSGFTGNQEIPLATSIMDYLFRWLAIRFPVDETGAAIDRHPAAKIAQLDLPRVPLMAKDFVETPSTGAESGGVVAKPFAVEVKDRAWVQETDAPPCHECGTLMVRNGACHKCPNCGSTSGCS
jgi:ribonucleoside-diphosphate reductase alpha chain